MAGAMGGAVMIGLGLALARPDKRVLVATGDGELLMSIGALATVAILNPANFSILVVDNGHYGETGWQRSHTSLGVDLEKIAIGSGIQRTRTVSTEGDIADGARLLREGNGTAFVVLRVAPSEPPAYKRNFDLAAVAPGSAGRCSAPASPPARRADDIPLS
jgi:thiamine pyrophosphate-dependent acetolactate synthase large subunit-like protein